ncbi:hypothetical protein DICPUDRAFT_83533 [Dictyostelium purpureum]|uniref:Uncharacterized protein n=1 Tax=Dictyostelium purpureum TaxID=5786 RepID=F0ZZT5_DICPU|nr:uncharacterized protein DICPUDRAFT_83533 [Dictyostelium purpureum]EGC30534.1 hypothetical protein DICPUDRAFT_83533 [Dictyostelium purpureum]|eukprot:XP_003292929.1 hypothetical protein DICPUDRAFT_83533 [Dictyostelium purpureum]
MKIIYILCILFTTIFIILKLNNFENNFFLKNKNNNESNNQTNCPIEPFQLLQITNDNKIKIEDNAKNIFSNLKGPLLIYSEIGYYSSFKSSRLDLYTMFLLKNEIKKNCNLKFFRVKIPKNGSSSSVDNENNCLGSRGCTRGIWVQLIKISDINNIIDNSLLSLKNSISNLFKQSQDGTIIFLDSEGSNDPDGLSNFQINTIQTILFSISSSISYIEPLQMNDDLIRNLAIKSFLFSMVLEYERYDNNISRNSIDLPKFNLIFSSSANLQLDFNPKIKNISNQLDKTQYFYNYLNDNKKDISSKRAINYFWGNNAIKSLVVLKATKNEMQFFLNEFSKVKNVPKELIYSREPGVMYSIVHKILPTILDSLSIKKYKGKVANGNDILNIILNIENAIENPIINKIFIMDVNVNFKSFVEISKQPMEIKGNKYILKNILD